MTCIRELIAQGLPHPRTCPEHGLKCPPLVPVVPVMTIEQMIYAAEQTLDMANAKGFHNVESDEAPELCYDHLTEMILMMRNQTDPGKVGRFLGFIQAAVIACPECLRLHDVMKLNKQILEGTYRE